MPNKVEARTLKGFKDYKGEEQKLRQQIIDTCRSVFELFGFESLDTPVLEYADILENKIGEDEKLIYKFEDQGGRQVAMRYDLTMSLARVVAQYQNELSFPYRRYQIGKVWRGDSPQKGRYREFMQADADIIGIDSLLADAECIAMYWEIYKRLGIKDFKIQINSRKVFDNLAEQIGLDDEQKKTLIRQLDKIDKIGAENVLAYLKEQGFTDDQLSKIAEFGNNKEVTEILKDLNAYLLEFGLTPDVYEFNWSLARGLDYYTGTIFETNIENSDIGSFGGGGRYDKLVESFSNQQISAVGMSIGVDRLLAVMQEQQIKPVQQSADKVIILNLGEDYQSKCLEILSELRRSNIPAQYYYEQTALGEQFGYAEGVGAKYAVIVGEDEIKTNKITVKNLETREQESITLDDLKSKIGK